MALPWVLTVAAQQPDPELPSGLGCMILQVLAHSGLSTACRAPGLEGRVALKTEGKGRSSGP